MNRSTNVTVMLLVAALFASAGCSTWKKSDSKLVKALDVRRVMWWKERKPDPQIPVRLVSSWTDTVLNRPGQKSQRGFGGRLSFFARESDDPVWVDGQLVVYAYDESKGDPQNVQPTRRYIFPREQFARLESKSSLGPSYSVWLPWDDDMAGPRKTISLIARFEPHGGPLLVGEQTRNLLPGTALAETVPAIEPLANGIQLASHNSPVGEPLQATGVDQIEKRPVELSSKSFHLSDRWRDRLATPTTVDSFRAKYATPVATQNAAPGTIPTATPTETQPQELPPKNSQGLQPARPSIGFLPGTRPAVGPPSLR